jgi:hypothetical protein
MEKKYEAPEVVTFGELDFEPTADVFCSTLVTCSGQHGNCVSTVTIGNT